jgi:hypothetical protein
MTDGCLYNFAAPGGYSAKNLDSVLADVRGGGKQASASPVAAPKHTASEIKSSHDKAVGGGRKRCRRGKNCSATCIAQNDECLVDFPIPVQNEIRKMVGYLLKHGNIEEGSERDEQLGAGATLLGRHLTGKTKSGETVFRTNKSSQSLNLTWGEVQTLKGLRNTLGKADVDNMVRDAFRKDVNSRGVNLDRKDLELLYGSLPAKAREQLNKSGDPGKGKWYGVEGGKEVINANGGSRARGMEVLNMYIRQGGTDGYSRSGKVHSPTEFDVEHIKPISKGGKDHPENWILARSGAQRKRNNTQLGEFIDSLPNSKKEHSEYVKADVKKALAKRAVNAIYEKMDAKSMSPNQLVQLPKAAFKYVFRGEGGTFFTNAFMPVSGGTRFSAGPPVPMSHTGALLKAYYPKEKFDSFAKELKQAWNTEWGQNGGSTAAMTNTLRQIASKYLTPEHLELVKPSLNKWASEFDAKYPGGKP